MGGRGGEGAQCFKNTFLVFTDIHAHLRLAVGKPFFLYLHVREAGKLGFACFYYLP